MIIKEAENPTGALIYDIDVDYWRNILNDSGREVFGLLPGDILVLSDVIPETLPNLQRRKWTWSLASVISVQGNKTKDCSKSTKFDVKSSRDLPVKLGEQKPLYAIFLMNAMANIRMWNSFHMPYNLQLIPKVLNTALVSMTLFINHSFSSGASIISSYLITNLYIVLFGFF